MYYLHTIYYHKPTYWPPIIETYRPIYWCSSTLLQLLGNYHGLISAWSITKLANVPVFSGFGFFWIFQDSHDYYRSIVEIEKAGGAGRWREINLDKAVKHKSLQNAHRLAVVSLGLIFLCPALIPSEVKVSSSYPMLSYIKCRLQLMPFLWFSCLSYFAFYL